MIEVLHNEFLPLTDRHLSLYVPSCPGVYMLAVRLASGVHQTFYTSQTDNLFRSLRHVLRKDESHIPHIITEYLKKYQCYFTCYVMLNVHDGVDIEEMFRDAHTPPGKLNIINCN
ncbi:MAG: hypothetical protein ACHQQQ_06790 [Bacteroidota bacterium]